MPAATLSSDYNGLLTGVYVSTKSTIPINRLINLPILLPKKVKTGQLKRTLIQNFLSQILKKITTVSLKY